MSEIYRYVAFPPLCRLSSFKTLMGRDVQPRFEFIMQRAPKVEEVDV